MCSLNCTFLIKKQIIQKKPSFPCSFLFCWTYMYVGKGSDNSIACSGLWVGFYPTNIMIHKYVIVSNNAFEPKIQSNDFPLYPTID